MVSGASPRRGIETLIEACRRLRSEVSRLRLRLALVGTTEDGRIYLDSLRASLTNEPWIAIETVPFAELSPWLADCSVLVLPHPAGRYFDAALPIKLFDYFAAGRPVVTTPRTATAERVVRHAAGLVTTGDAPDDLAASIGRLLADRDLARCLGAAGRVAAESTYDWQVIGRRLANDLLFRADRVRWFQNRTAHARRRLVRVAHSGLGRLGA
jgi:phosphatidylinositol alpha-1,6-mannosyltransferase